MITKMAMIKELAAANMLEEFKKTPEMEESTLIKHVGRTISKERIEELYKQLENKDTEEILDTVVDVAEKTVSALEIDYTPIEVDGVAYKKAWIKKVLDDAEFGKVSQNSRKKKVRDYVLNYRFDKNRITVTKNGSKINSTPALCEYITRHFIQKYVRIATEEC